MKQQTRIEIAAAIVAALGSLPQGRILPSQAESLVAIDRTCSGVVDRSAYESASTRLCEGKDHDDKNEGEAQSRENEKKPQESSKPSGEKGPSESGGASSKSREAVCGVLDKQ